MARTTLQPPLPCSLTDALSPTQRSPLLCKSRSGLTRTQSLLARKGGGAAILDHVGSTADILCSSPSPVPSTTRAASTMDLVSSTCRLRVVGQAGNGELTLPTRNVQGWIRRRRRSPCRECLLVNSPSSSPASLVRGGAVVRWAELAGEPFGVRRRSTFAGCSRVEGDCSAPLLRSNSRMPLEEHAADSRRPLSPLRSSPLSLDDPATKV